MSLLQLYCQIDELSPILTNGELVRMHRRTNSTTIPQVMRGTSVLRFIQILQVVIWLQISLDVNF